MSCFRMKAVTLAVCISLAVNAVLLSSCSDGIFGKIELSAPIEQMVRAYYGMSANEPITRSLLSGITSLTIIADDRAKDSVLAEFTVNGEQGYAQALPAYVHQHYWYSYIEAFYEPEVLEERGVFLGAAMYLEAFYRLLDPNDDEITDFETEFYSAHPKLYEKGPLYVFDPYASDRERYQMLSYMLALGAAESWKVGSYEFDASSLKYFVNLTDVEFVGFNPVNYVFPENVNVVVVNANTGETE